MALTKQISKVGQDGRRVVETVELTAEEETALRQEWASNEQAKQAKQAAEEAKQQKRREDLTETPASVNSVPALRAEVDKLKAIIRELTGVS